MSKKYTFTMVVVKPTGKGGKPLKPKPIKPKPLNKSDGGMSNKPKKPKIIQLMPKGVFYKGKAKDYPGIKEIIKNKNKKSQGGEMLKGGQKKLDKNKDGKISGEDFKMMKPIKAREGKMVKTPDGKMSEDKYSKYVRSIKLAEPKDIRNIVKKKSMGGDTSTEGNIKHGKLKSQKELKKITDSKEYKDSDYEQKTKMLNTATMNKGGEMKPGKVQKAGLGKMIKKIGRVIGFGGKKAATATPDHVMHTFEPDKGMGGMLPQLYQKAINDGVIKKSMGGDTSTEGNIKHGKLKSQKELKKITDSKEYKDSDYEQKTKMLNTATMNKGGEMKRGYGAARQSGMGLQDENLQPGKSMDYYKDLI